MRYVITAKRIITADKDHTTFENGFIAFEDGIIIGVGDGDGNEFVNHQTQRLHYGDQTILPGFIDTHCFFSGYALSHLGVNLANTKVIADVIELMIHQENVIPHVYIGRNLPNAFATTATLDVLSNAVSNAPLILFYDGGESCLVNSSAEEIYRLTSGTCYAERLWQLIEEMSQNKTFITSQFENYMTLLNSRGVTAIKDMTFDINKSLIETLHEMQSKDALRLKYNFMSQPVNRPTDLENALIFQAKYNSDYFKFSGFNQMTDGSISQSAGDLKRPYNASNSCCSIEIPYDTIRTDVLKADAKGLRYSLHAQGDAAVAKCVDIFSDCKRDATGKLVNRHCITDLELTDAYDLERMGWLGIIAEIYPQIPSLYTRKEKLQVIEEKIGHERGTSYWNRRKMQDANVILSCATDLPLLIDDIPESIYHACGAYFDDLKPFNPENAITINELLRAWTFGGAYNLGFEDKFGTLEIGKSADFAILDHDISKVSIGSMKKVKVSATWLGTKGCVFSTFDSK